jgi:hypothetical protein
MTYKCAARRAAIGNARTCWADEEARAEQKANGFDKYERDITCDDCFKKIMAGRSTEAAARGITPQELDAALEAEEFLQAVLDASYAAYMLLTHLKRRSASHDPATGAPRSGV